MTENMGLPIAADRAPDTRERPASGNPDDLPPRQRIRLIYEKGEPVKFISHHDEFRMWERTLRRADLPLLYKQGFNPQPHMQFASPLGVGITGAREPLDITLSPPLPIDEVRDRIQAKLPPGITLHSLAEVPLKTESLQNQLIGADYTILIFAEPGALEEELFVSRIQTFLATDVIPRERERKGKKYVYNLRPLIFDLRYDGYNEQSEEHRIVLRVQQRAGATGRPDEVVDALGLDDFARTLRRERLYQANEAADAELFANYPVIQQHDILLQKPEGHRRNRRGRHSTKTLDGDKGRSISERAGDEFG